MQPHLQKKSLVRSKKYLETKKLNKKKKKKREENEEGLEDNLEGDFLKGRTQHVIPARYETDSDESISFLDNIITEGCC